RATPTFAAQKITTNILMKKVLMPVLAVATMFAASCKKENTTPTPVTEQKIPYNSLTPTTEYKATFTDASGNTTVDHSGQTTRIAMLKELDAYMKTGTTANLDAVKMINMFRHQSAPFTAAELNAATDKTISSKTAQSFTAT